MTKDTAVAPEHIRDCGLRTILEMCGSHPSFPAAGRLAAPLSIIAIGLSQLKAERDRIDNSGETLPPELEKLSTSLLGTWAPEQR